MYFASSLSSNIGSSSARKKSPKTSGKPEKPMSKKKEAKKSPGKSHKPVTKSPIKSPTKHTPKSLVLVTKHGTNGSSMPMQSTGVVRSPSKPHTPRTPVKTPTKVLLLRTSSSSVIMSAKKTKTLKQIRSQLKRKFLTTEQRMKLEGEMKRKLDEQKEEKKRVRMAHIARLINVIVIHYVQQLQELREKKRAEKERLIELMKPKEDQLCEDSKVIFNVVLVIQTILIALRYACNGLHVLCVYPHMCVCVSPYVCLCLSVCLSVCMCKYECVGRWVGLCPGAYSHVRMYVHV